MPGRGEGDGLPVPMRATTTRTGGKAMYERDYDTEVPTNDELLAEIGLDSYTIRRIRVEAAHPETRGGEELS